MQPLRPGEEYGGENHRLGAFAARLWLPMLRAERNAVLMDRFDLLGPLPAPVHHGAGGQRRHR